MMPSIQTSPHMSDLTAQPQAATPVDNTLQEKIVPLSAIRLDGDTQSRAAMDDATIDEYTEAVKQGVTLPPVMLFFDGVDNWLADGFHRVHGYRASGVNMVSARVRNGTRRDAMLYSAGANSDHGLRRNNADKRHAVEKLLTDAEWAKWSDREIARQCNVSAPLVADVRKAICNPITDASAPHMEELQDSKLTRTVKRNGKEYTQHTQNMGKKVRNASACAPSTEASPTTDVQQFETKHANDQKSEASVQGDSLPEAPDELAACRKELGAAQALITILQIENAKLMQEVAILNARLKAAASGQGDDTGGAAAARTASEE